MELLRKRPDPGYPVEYLLSRIRGRRSRLIRDWRPLLYDTGLYESLPAARTGGFQKDKRANAVWRDLLAEYQWVYSQMNQQLRDTFFSFFLYAELRTIIICLRHHVDEKAGKVDDILDRSLLSDEVKNALLNSTDLPAGVRGIERLFSALSDRFSSLGRTLESSGLRGVEQRLIGTYLSVMIDADLHRLLNMFFSRLIDARNIMGLYKYLRLGLKVQPEFIAGGVIPAMRLKGIMEKDDLPGVALLIRAFTGIAIERPDSTAIELALYRAMTRWLKKEGRDPFGIAPILDYLWQCSIEAMNLSVLHSTRDLERDLVAAELVQ
jgi:vacuolar-type H+-ATPase subunit C/Vma6